MSDGSQGGFGIYIHWPFCAAKCPYCDFNSHVSDNIDDNAWKDAYLRDIDRIADELGPRVLNSVYFGGGTPSLMSPNTVDAVLRRIRDRFPAANDLEITLEANPNSVEAQKFRDFRTAGVNRVSIGVQALDDAALKALGRLHSVEEALRAVEVAQSTFDRVSFDLIYARQNQSLAEWQAELSQALTLGATHLSLYQLTIEDGTAFGRRHAVGTLKGLPDEDLAADMYFLTQEMCAAAGLPAYEVSNHAIPGQESKHNLIYWSYGEYAGIGPGAHGRITVDGRRYATETQLAPKAWLKNVITNLHESRTALTDAEQALEYAMMGLRIDRGIDLDRIKTLAPKLVDQSAVAALVEQGLLRQGGDILSITAEGRPMLNAIYREILEV